MLVGLDSSVAALARHVYAPSASRGERAIRRQPNSIPRPGRRFLGRTVSEGLEPLLAIVPAEAKVKALQERRRMIEAELTKPR